MRTSRLPYTGKGVMYPYELELCPDCNGDLQTAYTSKYKTVQTMNDIVNGRRIVTPSTARRLAKYFNISADFWMNLQLRSDMFYAQPGETAILKKIEPLHVP